MGGSIRMVIRFSDQTIYSATRHTNAFPHLIRQAEFINGDESVFRAYTEQQSDYVTDDRIAPCSYGIFLIDFVSKTVLSYNSYSDGQSVPIMSRNWMDDNFSLDDENNDGSFQRLITQGRLFVRYETARDPLATWDDPVPPDAYATWDETILADADRRSNRDFSARIAIDYVGWNFVSYWPRSRANKRLLIQAIKDLGFTIGTDRETRMRWGRLEIPAGR